MNVRTELKKWSPPEGHDGREFLFAEIALFDLFQIVERAAITQLHHLNECMYVFI